MIAIHLKFTYSHNSVLETMGLFEVLRVLVLAMQALSSWPYWLEIIQGRPLRKPATQHTLMTSNISISQKIDYPQIRF